MQKDTIYIDKTTLLALQNLVLQAGEAIMQIYLKKELNITLKADASPVTQADLTAHKILSSGLAKLTPMWPVVSEEDSESIKLRQAYTTYWLIDPLDGTKEFINGNGQFTVNLALIHKKRAFFGMVSTPIDKTLYWGGNAWYKNTQDWQNKVLSQTSWRLQAGTLTPLNTHKDASNKTQIKRVLASKSHLNQATQEFIDTLGKVKLIQAGSSLKFLRIAEGLADIYPRMSPTCEWDTAAAQAILEGAGGKVLQLDGSPVRYGKPDILNPHFIASS